MRLLLFFLLLCLPAAADPYVCKKDIILLKQRVKSLDVIPQQVRPPVVGPLPVRESQSFLATTPAPARIRVERDGQDLRLMGSAPLQVRTRRLGAKMRVDVSPAGSLACKLPEGLVLSWPESGTLRLEWRVPPNSVALCMRAADGRAVRLVLGRARPGTQRKTMSQDFVNADLLYVIKVLAKEMGRSSYIGPGVEGSVTVTLKSVPAEGALALILQMQESDFEYKVVSNGSGGQTLIVAPPEKIHRIPGDDGGSSSCPTQVIIHPGEGVRQEILLEKAPAAKVMEFLQGQYKNVQFTAHPTMNGFYVYGNRKDVLQIKSEISNLDRIPEQAVPAVLLAVKYRDVDEIKTLLETLVPDVDYEVDCQNNTLSLTGHPGAIDQVKKLLVEFDRPSEQIVIDAKLVDLTETQRKVLGLDSVRPHVHVLARTPFKITDGLPFLVASSEARVLAAPRVATESGKPAVLHIGDKRAPITSFDPVSGEFANATMDVGLTVNVLPSVKADGYIALQLDVEASFVTELVCSQDPCLTVQRDTHRLRLKDGDTVILPNLLPADAIKAAQAHLGLRDQPINGTLLRSVKPDSQIVLMLTPHIMK